MVRIIRYNELRPASPAASRAAQGSSRKRDTKPELLLRRALWRAGLRGYRVDARDLPGRPDIVFRRHRIAIFCDGDFWHGRDLPARLERLNRGHNAPYWVAKISNNVERDRHHDATLTTDGWIVLRYWESDIRRNVETIVSHVRAELPSALYSSNINS